MCVRVCVSVSLCTTVIHNVVHSSSDNLPSQHPDNHTTWGANSGRKESGKLERFWDCYCVEEYHSEHLLTHTDRDTYGEMDRRTGGTDCRRTGWTNVLHQTSYAASKPITQLYLQLSHSHYHLSELISRLSVCVRLFFILSLCPSHSVTTSTATLIKQNKQTIINYF